LTKLRNILREEIKKRVELKGGWSNAHVHLDRACTLNRSSLSMAELSLKDKWKLVRELKENVTVGELEYRMSLVIEDQIRQGVTYLCTFLDFDEYSKEKPFLAFSKVRERYNKEIKLECTNQAIEGVLDPKSEGWFNIGSSKCDYIGGLPGRDVGREKEHLEKVFEKSIELNKPTQIHLDQFNTKAEKETELTLDIIENLGLENTSTFIHCISLACHEKEYRENIYKRLSNSCVKVITCPTAWVDSRRSEEKTVIHNSFTPVDEMLEHGVKVSLGADNIFDMMCPFSSGDIYGELELLAKGLHIYDIDSLVSIGSGDWR
jgi:cytosine deaminase